ncbi:MAG: hypothetical protein U5K33_09330 [Halofilum sp. (in: g-proteobacteria)]|nr:hypothetical protein [Halofilum sp. (in: g-proteobacteria)]
MPSSDSIDASGNSGGWTCSGASSLARHEADRLEQELELDNEEEGQRERQANQHQDDIQRRRDPGQAEPRDRGSTGFRRQRPMNDQTGKHEKPEPGMILFVTGTAPRSQQAWANLATALKVRKSGAGEPVEIDLLTNPAQALSYSVFATPALMRIDESGRANVPYGDLSETDKLQRFLAQNGDSGWSTVNGSRFRRFRRVPAACRCAPKPPYPRGRALREA